MQFQKILLQIQKKKSFWIILIVGIILIINAPFLSIKNIVNTDEFPSLAVPAYYAGYDWSAFVSELKFHGYGFTILFMPFFKFFNNSEYIYLTVMTGALILRILMALIAFDMCSNFFSFNYKISALVAIICELGALSADDGGVPLSAMSELPSAFILIVSIMFLLKGWRNSGGKRALYISLMCFFMGYGYTIHSRSIVMWFSAFVVLLLYVFLYKEFDKKIFLYLAIFIGIIVLIACVDSGIQDNVWKVVDGELLANTITAMAGSKITGNIIKLSSVELVKMAGYIFCSLLGTLTIYTGGTIWFFTAINVSAISILWKRKKTEDRLLMILICFGIISFYVMNASIAISSTGSIQTENLRWLTYIRYCKPFGYLLVLTALICLFKGIYNKFCVRFFWFAGVCVSLFVLCTKTAEHLQSTGYNLQYSVLNRIWYNEVEESVTEYFMKMSLICLSITALAIIFWHKNRKEQILVIYVVFSLLIYIETYEYYAGRDLMISKIADGAEKIADSDGLKNCDIYIGGTDKYAMYLYWALYRDDLLYQNNRADIDLKENAVYFTDSVKDLDIMNANYIFVLDDNEYMFTSDRVIAQIMHEVGYEQY